MEVYYTSDGPGHYGLRFPQFEAAASPRTELGLEVAHAETGRPRPLVRGVKLTPQYVV